MIKLAIFASGSGTNAEQLIRYFSKSETIKVVVVLSNNLKAGVHLRSEKLNIPTFSFTREAFSAGKSILETLQTFQVDYIILAGFLNKIPELLLDAYPNRILNIHPSLLPKFGGKGMYGHHVHEAVLSAGEAHTGITIHTIDAHYDEGSILFQADCPVFPTDSADTLAARVHELEYQHYPRVIEAWIRNSGLPEPATNVARPQPSDGLNTPD